MGSVVGANSPNVVRTHSGYSGGARRPKERRKLLAGISWQSKRARPHRAASGTTSDSISRYLMVHGEVCQTASCSKRVKLM